MKQDRESTTELRGQHANCLPKGKYHVHEDTNYSSHNNADRLVVTMRQSIVNRRLPWYWEDYKMSQGHIKLCVLVRFV